MSVHGPAHPVGQRTPGARDDGERGSASAGPADRSLHSDLANAAALLAGPEVRVSVSGVSGDDGLFDKEAELVARASWKRRIEFAAGRRCARMALAALGRPPAAILRGPFMEPIFPPGYAGSISHDGGLAAALVCPTAASRRLYGLDLVDLRVRSEQEFDEVATVILSSDERRRPGPNVPATTFSIKEAAIKILSPLERRFVDFMSIAVHERRDGAWIVSTEAGRIVHARTARVGGVLISVAWLSGD